VRVQRVGNAPHELTFTFATGADFQEAGSQALLRADAETLVSRVLLFAGKNRARGSEAVRGDSFHLHVFLKLHVDRPAEQMKQEHGGIREQWNQVFI